MPKSAPRSGIEALSRTKLDVVDRPTPNSLPGTAGRAAHPGKTQLPGLDLNQNESFLNILANPFPQICTPIKMQLRNTSLKLPPNSTSFSRSHQLRVCYGRTQSKNESNSATHPEPPQTFTRPAHRKLPATFPKVSSIFRKPKAYLLQQIYAYCLHKETGPSFGKTWLIVWDDALASDDA